MIQIIRKQDRSGRVQERSVDVAESSGPWDALEDCSVLGLFDIENLVCGARDLGGTIVFDRLVWLIETLTVQCRLHAVFSREAGDTRLEDELSAARFVTHPRDIETVRVHNGTRRRANSDEKILFLAGALITRTSADTILLGSGDGDLVTELATSIRALPKPRRIVTISLAGSTAWRLDAAKNCLIDANIEIGLDALRQ